MKKEKNEIKQENFNDSIDDVVIDKDVSAWRERFGRKVKGGHFLAVIIAVLTLWLAAIVVLFALGETHLKKNIDNAKIVDSGVDSDGDGISDSDELNIYKTNPNSADSDGDGYTDDFELRTGRISGDHKVYPVYPGINFNPLLADDKIIIEIPSQTDVEAESEELLILGVCSPLIERIKFKVANDKNEVRTIEIQPPVIDESFGFVTWEYRFSFDNDTLWPGKNIIDVLGYDGDNITKKTINVNVSALKLSDDYITDDYITVDWNDKLTEFGKEGCDKEGKYCSDEYNLAGTIASKDLAGEKIYLHILHGMGDNFTHAIRQNDRWIELKKGNGRVKIKGISDLPEEINYPEYSGYVLKKDGVSTLFSGLIFAKTLFTDDKYGVFSLTDKGCIVMELPDHTAMFYQLKLPFINKENGAFEFSFNDGKKNEESYAYSSRIGCGFSVVKENGGQFDGRLQEVGKARSGEIFYELRNPKDQYLLDLYNNKLTLAYSREKEASKYTYDEYLALKPLLYWKDIFGRWVEFKNKKFESAAEMAKPVIYLYPEKETELKVRVRPNGGFLETVPEYNDGWEVLATPEA